jgi:integrase/recombinase XerC
MSAYVARIARPPRIPTALEQARLLQVTGERRDGFRDHMLFSLGLGTGLREHELVGLDIGDLVHDDGHLRRRVVLRVFKRSSANPARQEVFLPKSVRYKLGKFIEWKRAAGESLEPIAPLFVSRLGRRLSTRAVRHLFKKWQARAGFDHTFNFHSLRHAAVSNVFRETRDIRIAQRVARHKSVDTTMIYMMPTDQDIFDAVDGLTC